MDIRNTYTYTYSLYKEYLYLYLFLIFMCYPPSLNFSNDSVEDNVDEDEDVVNILKESELDIEDIDDSEKLKKLGMDLFIDIRDFW